MGGDAYNKEYVQAQRLQAQSNEEIADTQGEWDYKVAKEQSQAVVRQAELDYQARLHEADTNKEIQMEALRVREKEANLQFKVDWKNAQNDAVRAEATLVNAQANVIKAEAKQFKEESNRQRDELRYSDNGDTDYWYGNA